MKFKLFGLIFSISRPKTVSVPDFLQEAKIASIRFVPEESDKVYYILGRFAHATGSMREFLRNNPEERGNPEFTKQILQATSLWHQFDSAPLKSLPSPAALLP